MLPETPQRDPRMEPKLDPKVAPGGEKLNHFHERVLKDAKVVSNGIQSGSKGTQSLKNGATIQKRAAKGLPLRAQFSVQ